MPIAQKPMYFRAMTIEDQYEIRWRTSTVAVWPLDVAKNHWKWPKFPRGLKAYVISILEAKQDRAMVTTKCE